MSRSRRDGKSKLVSSSCGIGSCVKFKADIITITLAVPTQEQGMDKGVREHGPTLTSQSEHLNNFDRAHDTQLPSDTCI